MLCGVSVHCLLYLQGHGCKMAWEASLVSYEISKKYNHCLFSLSAHWKKLEVNLTQNGLPQLQDLYI